MDKIKKIKIFITMRTITLLVFLTTLLILSGCNSTPSNGTNEPASLPSPNEKDTEVVSKQAQEPESNLPQELPTPTIQSESGISIPAVQGSYCWGGMCADYVGGMDLLKGHTPVPVLVGEKVSVDMGIEISPAEFELFEYVENTTKPISSTDRTFQLPKEPGNHYYGAFVSWSSPQDSHISLGDTSFAFVIRVVEKK